MWDLTTAFERAPRDLFIAPEDSGEKECGISQVSGNYRFIKYDFGLGCVARSQSQHPSDSSL